MKPKEYWDSTYREINIFTQSNICRILDELRNQVQVQEASTDKLIQADGMSMKHPKIIPIRDSFKGLFPEKEEKLQTPSDIIRIMRGKMKEN